MSTAEAITVVGIVVVIFTTVAGWIFTYRAQRKIQDSQLSAQRGLAELQDRLTFRREQAQLLIDDRLEGLKEIANWIQLGREIYLEAYTHSQRASPSLPAEQALSMYESVGPRLLELRANAPKYYYLARLWDPKSSGAQRWKWGEFEAPVDLPQLIRFYEDEVSDQVSEALLGPDARERPFIEDQFHGLHEASVRAVERLKEEAASKKAS